MTQPHGNYQLEIYFQGLSGVLPSLPMSFEELQSRAQQALSPSIWSYVAGGAGDERTQRANVTAFEQWGLIPRMLVGATERDMSVELWGRRWPAVFMAPVGVIGLCTADRHGDIAAARAAARTGIPLRVDADDGSAGGCRGRIRRHPRAFPALYAHRPRARRKSGAPR